jgi:hypothetical protein
VSSTFCDRDCANGQIFQDTYTCDKYVQLLWGNMGYGALIVVLISAFLVALTVLATLYFGANTLQDQSLILRFLHAHAHAHSNFICPTRKPLSDLATNTHYDTLTFAQHHV